MRLIQAPGRDSHLSAAQTAVILTLQQAINEARGGSIHPVPPVLKPLKPQHQHAIAELRRALHGYGVA